MATSSFLIQNNVLSGVGRAGQSQQNASAQARTARGRQRLRGMIGLLGLLFALFPLIAAQPVAARPHITEFQAPPADIIGEVNEITAGSDAALWFTTNGSNVIGRITTKGMLTTFTLPSFQFNTQAITSGPDGALWFALPNSNSQDPTSEIGRLTTQKVFTGFVIPFKSFPWGITTGPDGNLYFTDQYRSAIDRITPQGAVTRFPYNDGSTNPVNIITGPDGNLWFTQSNGRIGKMTPTGKFTFFPLPGAPALLLDAITTGPDGNIWFTVDGVRGQNTVIPPKIGYITPNGAVTEHTLPAPPQPYNAIDLPGITTGPDGNLWFTHVYINGDLNHVQRGTVGRITPKGAFRLFPTPSQPSAPLSITAGPDGNLWFTEPLIVNSRLVNRIGRITTH